MRWTRKGFLYLVHRYANECFAREDPPRVQELADRLGVSSSTLRRQTQTYCGVTPSVLLRTLRRRQAQKLLRRTNLSTTTVAYRAAYGSRRTLFRAFRRETGRSPREHERENTAAAQPRRD